MGKWLAEIAAAVIAGIIVWWLTTGPHVRRLFFDTNDTTVTSKTHLSELVITSIEGSSGIVGSNPLLKINYRSSDCDVIGGRWAGASGSGLTAQFGKSNSCSNGTGYIYFGRTCFWPGVWREYITLYTDRGKTSSSYEYTYTCKQS